MPIRVRCADFCIAILAFAVVVASFFVVYADGGGRPTVNLRAENAHWVFPLDSYETVVVPGPLGDTVVEIRGNGARVVSSPCTDQICVVMGAVRLSGQWSACLPNRVMLYVSAGGNGQDVDAVVR
ncbi:MAG: NusG domain II-containing protein [Treponema sp.]|nr:NusG domain II-containing protein [Treponema sp.]